jgi:CTP synthase
MDEQRAIADKGGTMRLGSYECSIPRDSIAHRIYGSTTIHERHRHRYEFNNEYRDALGEKGLKAGGVSPDGKLVEMVEYADHPWFVGVQFHPEFKSRPMGSHPLFSSYLGACVAYKSRLLTGKEPPKRKEQDAPECKPREMPAPPAMAVVKGRKPKVPRKRRLAG